MSDEDPNYIDPNLVDDDFEDDDEDDFVDEIGADGNRVVGARAVAVAEHVTRSLAEDHLGVTRVAVAGELARARRRSDAVERNDAPLGFRDSLLRDDHNIAVLELHGIVQELGEVVPRLDLRQALDSDHADLAH